MRALITRRGLMGGMVSATALCAGGASRAVATSDINLSRLRRGFGGALITPLSPLYSVERRTVEFNPRTNRYPAVIAKCASEDDVVRCLDFAARERLEVSVRSGGHDALAASTCDGGIVIDMRAINRCVLGPSGKTVIVGGGVKAGELTSMLQQSRLAVPLGDSGDVGIAGLSLGGGYGWLVGTHGAACDALRRVRLILADGRRVTANAEEHPDLFWAIRGGGGNFGIASEFEFETSSIDFVIAGVAVFDGTDLGAFLRFYRDYRAAAPEALAIEVGAAFAERPLILAQVCWSGDAAEGEKALAPLLAFASPLAFDVTRRRFDRLADASAEVLSLLRRGTPLAPSTADAGAHWRGGSIGGLDDAAIAVIVARMKQASGRAGFNLTHYLHGAVCRVPDTATALVRPKGSYSYHFHSLWNDAEEGVRQMAWADQSWAALQPYSIPTYVNYLSSDDPREISRTYGPNFDRLRQIKRRYDPANMFHRNRNIPPAV